MCKCGRTHNKVYIQEANEADRATIQTLLKRRDAMQILVNSGMYHMQSELDHICAKIALLILPVTK